jgi:AhpD family alkylhydroperoxidase
MVVVGAAPEHVSSQMFFSNLRIEELLHTKATTAGDAEEAETQVYSRIQYGQCMSSAPIQISRLDGATPILKPFVRALSEVDAPLLAKRFYGGGDPGPIAATMAHVPELLETALPFIGGALSPSAIDFRTKEIVILRTSVLLQCRYCIDSHTPVALDSGLSHAETSALRNEDEPLNVFASPRERALISWNDAVAGTVGRIDPAVRAEFAAHFAEHEIVELTLLIGATMLLNRYATSLELPVHPDTLIRLAKEGFAAS